MASLSDRIIAMLEKPEGSKAILSLIDEAKGVRSGRAPRARSGPGCLALG
jgi:hypothetical protein